MAAVRPPDDKGAAENSPSVRNEDKGRQSVGLRLGKVRKSVTRYGR